MDIKITVPNTVSIPDDRITELCNNVRERFEMEPDAPVAMIDLVRQAIIDECATFNDEHDPYEYDLLEFDIHPDDDGDVEEE